MGERRYVTAIDPDRNVLVIGDDDDLGAHALDATRARFFGAPPADGTRVGAVVRYRGEEVAARFSSVDNGFVLEFDRPVRAVSPGQAVVLYDGNEVLGGGTIKASR